MFQRQLSRGGRHAQRWLGNGLTSKGSVTFDLPKLPDSWKRIFTSNTAHPTCITEASDWTWEGNTGILLFSNIPTFALVGGLISFALFWFSYVFTLRNNIIKCALICKIIFKTHSVQHFTHPSREIQLPTWGSKSDAVNRNYTCWKCQEK